MRPRQLRRRAVRHDLAAVEEDDLVADAVDLVHVVAGEQDRQLAVAPQVLNQAQRLVGDVGVERRGRLVHEDELRVVEHRLDQHDAGALAGREVAVAPRRQLLHLEVIEQLVDLAGRLVDLVEVGEDEQVLPHRRAVLQVVVGRGEVDPPQRFLLVREEVPPEVLDRAAVGDGRAEQDVDARRLAGAVGAQQANDAAFFDGERDAGQGAQGAEVLGQAFDFEKRFHERAAYREQKKSPPSLVGSGILINRGLRNKPPGANQTEVATCRRRAIESRHWYRVLLS